MSDSSARSPTRPSRPDTPTQPDSFFRFVAGLYAALVCAPLAVAVLAGRGVSDDATLYVALLTTLAVVTAFGSVCTRRLAGLPERVGRSSWRWLLAVLPAATMLTVLVAASAVGQAVPWTALLAFVFAGLAGVVGAGLGVMAGNRYVAALVDDRTPAATWRAGWPERARRRLTWVAMSLVGLSVAGWTSGLLLPVPEFVPNVSQILFALPVVLLGFASEKDYEAYDEGLVVDLPVARRLVPWSAFDDCERTADAIVLRRVSPWRVDVRFALADLDDPEVLEAVLCRSVKLDR
jgi:hypothetical protein